MLAENRQIAKYGNETFTPLADGIGLPSFNAFFQRLRRMSEMVLSGISSRELNVWAATNRKNVIGSHRKKAAAASAPALPAPLVFEGLGFAKKFMNRAGPSFA